MTSLASPKALPARLNPHLGTKDTSSCIIPRTQIRQIPSPGALVAADSSVKPFAKALSISVRPGGSMDSLHSFRAAMRRRYRRYRRLTSSTHLKMPCTPGVRNDNGAMQCQDQNPRPKDVVNRTTPYRRRLTPQEHCGGSRAPSDFPHTVTLGLRLQEICRSFLGSSGRHGQTDLKGPPDASTVCCRSE
jgi:hypothetical protein